MINARGSDALGYAQLTALDSAAALSSVPAGTDTVVLQAESQDVRYRDDGSSPTATVGMKLIVDTIYEFSVAQIGRMRFIETTASAKLNVSYYGKKTA